MIEKMPAVGNPLTIIAIFAALAEVAGTLVLARVDPSIQATFVWFVMLFPVLIVLLFFITLNFNPKVLYAPSDFKDENNYMIANGSQRTIEQLMTLQEDLRQMKLAFPAEYRGTKDAVKLKDGTNQARAIQELVDRMEETLASTLKTSEEVNLRASEFLTKPPFPAAITDREKQVWKLVSEGKKNREIAEELGISPKTVEVHRAYLMQKLGANTAVELALMYKTLPNSTGNEVGPT